MGQAGKQVLWQQHAYIAATLEDRNDKEELGKYSFSPLFAGLPLWEIQF